MATQHYCDYVDDTGHKCFMTFPCSLHPSEQYEVIQQPTTVKVTELPIRVITIIPIPCGHAYPWNDEKKKFTAICGYCDSKFLIEIKDDVCEIVRI